MVIAGVSQSRPRALYEWPVPSVAPIEAKGKSVAISISNDRQRSAAEHWRWFRRLMV